MNEQGRSKIVIVGGGTAGWMAACLMQQAWREEAAITLIEASDIPIIGVGEGSTPYMRQFFKGLGIAEKEWMPACNATYKCGISFPDWSTKAGFTDYFHPFFSRLDIEPSQKFFVNCNRRRREENTPAHPNDYWVAAALARNRKSPVPKQALPFDHDYAYHFDAGLVGSFLKEKAKSWGVKHVLGKVDGVRRAGNGDLVCLQTAGHGEIHGDLFIDCSGFAGLLINQTLKEPFLSYKENLFNDSAVAIQTALQEEQEIPSETVSRALSNGWAWRIPLTQRFGNGYVYSSDFISADEAELELRNLLGAAANDAPARHLKMRVGRVENHWKHNCLAVGLSQGFIEPLEATALALVQYTIENFIETYSPDRSGGDIDKRRNRFNQKINRIFEGTRDYIVLHYQLNSRDDSDYWRANRVNAHISDSLREILESWDRGDDFDATLSGNASAQVYMRPSWYCILSGMGRYSSAVQSQPERRARDRRRAAANCSALAAKFYGHREYLLQLERHGVGT